MKIHEILDRDPRKSALANNGTARISTSNDEAAILELRAELETFVCDGQYGDALERILANFIKQLDRPRQDAAWVSGFFGSGKSHLLKMLGHLWVDTKFSDGATARSLVHGLPDEATALLRELDVRVSRSRVPAVAAAGSLPSGSKDAVRSTVLSVILRAKGLPEAYAQAQFCFWLRENGFLDPVRSAVERAGKEWLKELNNLHASPILARAVLACDANFAKDEKDARGTLRSRFPNREGDITTPEFIEAVRAALASEGSLPLTILVLDEVQQFIGDSTDRSVIVSETAEAIQTQLDSRVLLVASGQSALAGTPQLQRLKDRFRINAQLSDADIEFVTRKVLLQKKPSGIQPVRDVLERNAGEVSRQLQGTRLAERAEDRRTILDDYPLLPTRRRFWEECFRCVDTSSSHSQLRSQLRILHEALLAHAEKDVGAVIPADVLFRAIAPDLVQSGVLMNELATRIQRLDDGSITGGLPYRIAGLVFLVNRVKDKGTADAGLRATSRTIADLLIDDIEHDTGPFRRDVEAQLEGLVQAGTLMKVGEEYRLQTSEGAEWDRAFREKVAALGQQPAEGAIKRDQILAAAVQKVVSEIRFKHGDAKVARGLSLRIGSELPSRGDDIFVWLRDGFSSSQKEIENEARRLGQEDPTVHVFLPKKAAGDLAARIAEAAAAQFVIDTKGLPAGNEGQEARESMRSRLSAAEDARDALVSDIIASARVYQSGGNELFGDGLRTKLETAVVASVARLFPRFGEGDAKATAWETALKRARDGSDQPFVSVGWDRATEDHPVVRQVLAHVGPSSRGIDVSKALEAAPFGWPRDAIHAALAALLRSGTLRATLNGQAITVGQVDQSKLPACEFRPERVRLGMTERVALRGMFLQVGVVVRSGEEETKAPVFLDALLELAEEAGGDPPLPARPPITRIEDWRRLAGSEQLGALHAARGDIETCIKAWTVRRDLALLRGPAWVSLEQLCQHAKSLPIAAELAPELAALRASRALLDDTDRVAPLTAKLTGALRAAVTEQSGAWAQAHADGLATLRADMCWQETPPAEQMRILTEVGLVEPTRPAQRTNDELLAALDAQPLEARDAAAAAVPERVARALAMAARLQQPSARRVPLRQATLADEPQVRAWLSEQGDKLIEAVKSGPVIVG